MTNMHNLTSCGDRRGPGGPGRGRPSHTLRAALHRSRGGERTGAAIRQWGHVTTFSPWRYMVDGAARELLEGTGWQHLTSTRCRPATISSISYVQPLANHPAVAPHVRYRRARGVGWPQGFRQGADEGPGAAAVRNPTGNRRDDRGAGRDRCQRHMAAPESRRVRRRAGARRARACRSHRLRHSRRRRPRSIAICRQARARGRQRPFRVQRDPRFADACRAGARHRNRLGHAPRQPRHRVGRRIFGCAGSARRTGAARQARR